MASTAINGIQIVHNGQDLKVWPGDSVADASLVGVLQAEGCVMIDSATSWVIAASALVAKARARGASEADCQSLMMAAMLWECY